LRVNLVGQRFQTLSATKHCEIKADKLPEQRTGPFLLNPATTLAFRHVGHIRNRPPAIPPIYARKPLPKATLSKIAVPWKTRNQLLGTLKMSPLLNNGARIRIGLRGSHCKETTSAMRETALSPTDARKTPERGKAMHPSRRFGVVLLWSLLSAESVLFGGVKR
jgi:hypothetical protein